VNEFRFAEPGWGLLLWGVLAFTALLVWLDVRAGTALSRFLSPVMQARLAETASVARRRTAIALLGLSLAMGVVALMRPQWGLHLVATPRVGAEIMVCLDVSNSMLAEDVAPNRLERAKAEVRDLLSYLRGDSVGLIAFAGRASVLAPITPDFSFLRMVLDSAGPRSVSRGGTRLEEPIRKAVAGFAAGASVSRSIILITDGEDHDSFPLEAAKEAAERGIKILAIGFGDEKGSPIQVTDPKTGAKKTLRDASGAEVVTRLDGDTLREIALATGGAYVPAGTGVLDLQSIYETHIAGLTRGSLDGQSRAIRGEAYQLAVLAALVLLVAAVAVASGRGARKRSAAVAAAAMLLAITFAAPAPHARADDAAAPAAQAEAAQAGDGAAVEDAAGEDATTTGADSDVPAAEDKEEEPPRPARLVYNEGVDKLAAGDLDAAEKLLEDARSRAGFDGELRRDATYDLGILEARRADGKIESAPEEALAALERSASWFRETVSLDAKDEDARHNLELVLRRALVLADAIAKKKQKELIDDVTALMEEQRAFLGTLRTAVQDTPAEADANAADPERNRAAFRELATRELALSSKAEDVSERAAREQTLVRSKPADQQTPEETMKAVQMDGVLESLHHAREQMGQARGRLRRLEGPGAYRAASTTLTHLKRARDRLLDPVQVLDILISDALELARLSGVKVAIDAGSTEVPPQKWLTPEHLADTSDGLHERIAELHYNFVTVVTQSEAAAQGGAAAEPGQAALLERVREAEPLIGEGAAKMSAAKTELEAARIRESLPFQYEAIAKLAAARESFLELERLIDLLWQEEKRIESIVSPKEPDSGASQQPGPGAPQQPGTGASEPPAAGSPEAKAEYAPLAAEAQRTNTKRGEHVERALDESIAAADQAIATKAAEDAAAQQQGGQAAPAQPSGPDPAAEKQRLELARTYLTAARGALGEAESKLDTLESEAASLGSSLPAEAWAPSQAAVKEAVERIEDLRRLFFSVLDHLKELAQRQLELGDQTEETAAMASAAPDRDFTDKAGPLAARQETLSTTAAPIADALREQSQQPVPPEAQGQVPEDLPQKLAEAATHVDNARTSMDGAVASLGINPPAFADTRSAQNTALEELARAIQLLTPPEQQKQQQEQQDQQQKEEQQQQGDQKDEQQQQQQQQQQAGQQPKPEKGEEEQDETDPAQLLQGIRDREAERRENREKAQRQGYEPVEKDW
jgi:Ca-activated chloride channel family protein